MLIANGNVSSWKPTLYGVGMLQFTGKLAAVFQVSV